MKKLFPKDPAETRRDELNKSATDLARHNVSSASSRPCRDWIAGTGIQPSTKRRRVMGRIGNALLILAAFALTAINGVLLAKELAL